MAAAIGVAPAHTGQPLSRERPEGRFVRTLTFPDAVVPGSAQASLSSGVLSVRFEKRRKTWLQRRMFPSIVEHLLLHQQVLL